MCINIYVVTGISRKFDENLRKRLAYAYKCSNNDIIKSILLLQKYVYPYEYINYWEKLNETSLIKLVLRFFINGHRGVVILSNLTRNDSSKPSQRNMGLSHSKLDHDYCRLLPRVSLGRTWFRVPFSVGFKQMEVESNTFQVNFLGSLNAIHRFASRVSYHIPTYLAWKPGPYSKRTDAFQ